MRTERPFVFLPFAMTGSGAHVTHTHTHAHTPHHTHTHTTSHHIISHCPLPTQSRAAGLGIIGLGIVLLEASKGRIDSSTASAVAGSACFFGQVILVGSTIRYYKNQRLLQVCLLLLLLVDCWLCWLVGWLVGWLWLS